MNRRFLIIMAVAIAAFAALIVVNKKDADAPNSGGQITNHVFNKGSSGVTVIEYGDFQCPACFSYYPIFKQLKEEYKDTVTFQFRNFPIISAHPNAMAAHRAAEAASNQGKFWEMHDLLYERQKSWEKSNNAAEIFSGYATELGLNMEQYTTDVNSSATNANIQADFKAGEEIGVTGTPGFVIDGKLIENPNSVEAFKKLIDEAIASKKN